MTLGRFIIRAVSAKKPLRRSGARTFVCRLDLSCFWVKIVEALMCT